MKYVIKNINSYSDEIISDTVYKNNLRNKQFFTGRKILKEMVGENFIINISNNGKPYFKDNNIYFNISHRYEYVICATNNDLIGVDIEKIDNIDINKFNKIFNKNELKYINNNLINFYTLYTLKEAYIKMLDIPLSNISNINIIHNNKIKFNNNIKFKTFKYNNYIISICYK